MDDFLQFPHKLTLQQREDLTMTGVTEVVCFDDTEVILKTQLGRLTVLGEDLSLKTLNPEGGQVAILGKIASLSYEEPRPAGFFRRMLS